VVAEVECSVAYLGEARERSDAAGRFRIISVALEHPLLLLPRYPIGSREVDDNDGITTTGLQHGHRRLQLALQPVSFDVRPTDRRKRKDETKTEGKGRPSPASPI
jgi:hypothetical protein